MMPVDFEKANFTFGKPIGMSDEECSSLRVFRGTSQIEGTETKVPCIISKWQPSKEDIEEISKGGAVYLSITGHGMPPVALFTEDPFVV